MFTILFVLSIISLIAKLVFKAYTKPKTHQAMNARQMERDQHAASSTQTRF